MSAPGQFDPAPAPQKSGGGMSVLVIILIVVGVLILACAGLCAGCVYSAGQAVKKVGEEVGAAIELSMVYEAAPGAVTSDPAVIEKLGEPVVMEGLPTREGVGELKTGGETFTFDVRGPMGQAQVTASAFKDAGAWKITVITVQFPDGTTINVPPPVVEAPELNFDMPESPDDTK
jgi:hypothetical protein